MSPLSVPNQSEMGHFQEAIKLPEQDSMMLAAPKLNTMLKEGEHEKDGDDMGETKVTDLIPCYACCCGMSSIFCKFPDCLGCDCNFFCCCCQGQGKACKPTCACDDDDGTCCICTKGECSGVKCCSKGRVFSSQGQCCCADNRYAIPCHEENPCFVNLLGLTCCADWGCACSCCKNVGDILPKLKAKLEANQNSKV